MHMPPASLHLGQLQYPALDIGSVDIYYFLKEKQPLLSLHGHIHECPDTQKGKWINGYFFQRIFQSFSFTSYIILFSFPIKNFDFIIHPILLSK